MWTDFECKVNAFLANRQTKKEEISTFRVNFFPFCLNVVFSRYFCIGVPHAQQNDASAGFFCPHCAQKT